MTETTAERDAERDRKRWQRECQRQCREVRVLCAKAVRIQGQLENALAALEEVVSSGKNQASALYADWKQAWCRVMKVEEYACGNPAADMKVLRRLVTAHEPREVRAKAKIYFSDGDDWTKRQNWSVACFEKRYHQLDSERSDPARDKWYEMD